MRLLVGIMVCLLMLSSVAVASPLMDYSQGKTAIDITVYPSLNFDESNNLGVHYTPKGESNNYDFGITAGLSNRFAVQYRQFNPETEIVNEDFFDKINNRQLNVLYKIDKDLVAFVGYNHVKVKETYINSNTTRSGKRNMAQVGLIGSTQIDDKTNLFGTIGIGNDYTNYEIGLSYNVDKNLEMNICYRNAEAKDISPAENPDIKAKFEYKGFGYGLTYKF